MFGRGGEEWRITCKSVRGHGPKANLTKYCPVPPPDAQIATLPSPRDVSTMKNLLMQNLLASQWKLHQSVQGSKSLQQMDSDTSDSTANRSRRRDTPRQARRRTPVVRYDATPQRKKRTSKPTSKPTPSPPQTTPKRAPKRKATASKPRKVKKAATFPSIASSISADLPPVVNRARSQYVPDSVPDSVPAPRATPATPSTVSAMVPVGQVAAVATQPDMFAELARVGAYLAQARSLGLIPSISPIPAAAPSDSVPLALLERFLVRPPSSRASETESISLATLERLRNIFKN